MAVRGVVEIRPRCRADRRAREWQSKVAADAMLRARIAHERARFVSRVSVRLPDALATLGAREFRLLISSQTASQLGGGIASVALPFAVLDLTGSVSALGLVSAAGSVPAALFILLGGVVSDRLSRRAVMVVAEVVRCAIQSVTAVLLITGEAKLWQLAVTQAVVSTAGAFFSPAATGLLPAVVGATELQQANALRGLAVWTGIVLGPALGGVIVAAGTPGWAFAVQAVAFGVSALLLTRLRLPAITWRSAESFVHDLQEGWREVVSRSWLGAMLCLSSVGSMAFTAVFVLGAYVSKQSLGGPGVWALTMSMLGLGGIAGGVLALRIRPRRPLLTSTFGWVALALLAVLLALRVPADGVAVGGLIAGVALGVFYPLWESVLQRRIPPHALSRVSAYDWLAWTAVGPLGKLLVGPIAAGIGIDVTLWGLSAVLVIVAAVALALPGVRGLQESPVVPEFGTEAAGG